MFLITFQNRTPMLGYYPISSPTISLAQKLFKEKYPRFRIVKIEEMK